MLNKKGGVAVEEIRGILTFMFVAVVLILLFYGCSVNKIKNEYRELKFSKGEIEAAKALNFFLEIDADEERKVMDLVVESFNNDDYGEFREIVEEHFSSKYDKWRLVIYDSKGYQKFNSHVLPSDFELGALVASSYAQIPILNEDSESIIIIFEIHKGFG